MLLYPAPASLVFSLVFLFLASSLCRTAGRSQAPSSSHLLLSVLLGTPLAEHDFSLPSQAWVLLGQTGAGSAPGHFAVSCSSPAGGSLEITAQLSSAPILSRRGRREDAPGGCHSCLCLLLVPNPDPTPSASVQTDCLFPRALFHLSP